MRGKARLCLCAVLALCLLPCCTFKGLPWGESEVTVYGDATAADAVSITLSDRGSSCDSAAVRIDGGTVTITAAGDYLVSGALSDGQLVVDAGKDAKVRLILDGVTLVKTGSAAVYARSADKLVLSSAEDSVNLIQAVGTFAQDGEDKVDAAVYAKCDLTLSGKGVLNISSLTGHAVVSKDDLKLKSGTVNLEAALKGLYGRDSVTVEGGVLNADVGTDALCADNCVDPGKGAIFVSGGVLNLLAQKDGLDASGDIDLSGGALTVSAGSGEEGKGLAADGSIIISGSSLVLSAVDDAIHASGDVTISGGALVLSSGDDGVHADKGLLISGGSLAVERSYEGLEAQVITVSGGDIRIIARDDGFNAAGGRDSSNGKGAFGGDPFAADVDAAITVTGGTIQVNAGGDGLDSNGSLTVTGGTVYISGPTGGANGALDYGTEATITGGTVIAVGTAEMAENFGPASTQGSILLRLESTQQAGTLVAVCDEKGKILASYEPEKPYNAVVISTPGLFAGGTYTVLAGTEMHDITLESLLYGSGGMPGGPDNGGFSGRPPEGLPFHPGGKGRG